MRIPGRRDRSQACVRPRQAAPVRQSAPAGLRRAVGSGLPRRGEPPKAAAAIIGNVNFAQYALPAALLLLAGCSKNIQTNEAVKAGVIKHLAQNSGLNLASMDIEVTAVTFRDNEADATVGFKPKGSGAASGMSMRYTLERKGGEWVVKKKTDSGMGHGMAMPGAGSAAPPAGAMPPGHPPVGGPAATPERKQ